MAEDQDQEPLSTMGAIRQRYPMYGDLSDGDLADRFHKKFYSDMPRDQFDAKMAAPAPPPLAPPRAKPALAPMEESAEPHAPIAGTAPGERPMVPTREPPAPGYVENIEGAATEPFKRAWNADYGAKPEGMPAMAWSAVSAVQRALDLGMAAPEAAIGTVAATMGLDPKAVNQWVTEYAPGLVGVEGAPHEQAPRVPSPAKAALDNIAEGKPAAAPRPETVPPAETAPPAADAGPPVGAAPAAAPEVAPAGGPPAAAAARPIEPPLATLERIARGEPEPPPRAPPPIEPTRPGMWPEAPEPEAARAEAAAPAPAVAPLEPESSPYYPPPRPSGAEPPAPKRPENILEFLARNGGLERDESGELEAMDAHKKFMPGAGMLVRKVGGMSLDEAREKAEEAGYLQPDSDINDLLGAVDNNLRGNHVFSDRDMTAADEWREHTEGMRRNPEEEIPGFAAQSPQPPQITDTSDTYNRWLADRGGAPGGAAAHANARDYVIQSGKASGTEHLVGLDAEGRTIAASTSALDKSVHPTAELLTRMYDPRERITVHHNHPIDTGLSYSDVRALGLPGNEWVVAHSHDGGISAARLTSAADRALGADANARTTALGQLYAAGQRVAYYLLEPELRAGRLTMDQATMIQAEAVNHALSAAGVIDHLTSRAAPEHLLPPPLLQAVLERTSAAVAQEAPRYGIRPSPGFRGVSRWPEPVRPERGMAQVAGAPAELSARAAPRQPGEGGDQGGGTLARPSAPPREEGGEGPGTLSAGKTGAPGAEAPERLERTDQGLQRVIPGAEQSARQAAASRETSGRSKLQPSKPQRAADEGLFGKRELPQPKLPGFEAGRFGTARQGNLPVTTPQQMRKNGLIARSFLGKIFSPSTVSPVAERQAAISRQEYGEARRLTQQAKASLEQFRATAPDLSTPEGRNFMAYVEGRSGGAQLSRPEMRPLADHIRMLNKNREQAVRQLPGQAQRAFIEDYYAHMWKDPQAAQQAIASTTRGGAWQGSGRNLKGRTIPTYADGIAMGLEPLHPNVVDGEMAYLSNIDRFIGTNRILQRMKAEGSAKAFIPGRQPEGWVPLNGALVEKAMPIGDGAVPMKTFAPEDAARVYNNMVSRGVWDTAAAPVYDKLMSAKNFMTAAELSFSLFHANTMATEAMFSQIGRAAGQLKGGRPIDAARTFATFPAAPVKSYLAGRKMAAEYIEPGSQSAQIAQAMGLLTKANLSPLGRGESQYFAGTHGPFGGAVTQGGFRAKAQAVAQDLKSAFHEAVADVGQHPVTGVVRQLGRNTARAMDTISSPLFDHAIPRLKAGAAMERMSDWLKDNPTAPFEDQLKAARDISDSIDNRFGELVYDNVFWHNAAKQIAFLTMRAVGWNLGTHREIEGGLADMARGKWSPRVEYLVGLGVGSTLLNGVMTTLKTGQAPKSPMDFFAYDTGQKDDRGNPIRGMLPGYAREYVTAAMNAFAKGPASAAGGYAYGKLASLWSGAYELFTNRDYRDDPIGPPGAGVMTEKGRAQLPEFVKRYAKEALGHFVPINWRDALGIESPKDMKGISKTEQALAIRAAPFATKDPAGAQRFFAKQANQPKGAEDKWKAKLKRERRAAAAAEQP
jgi:hypothetical protein